MNNKNIFHSEKEYIKEEWISVCSQNEHIEDENIVLLTFCNNCIELIGFDNMTCYSGQEYKLYVERHHKSEDAFRITTYMKYIDAKAFLKHIGYVLYDMDCKTSYIDTINEAIAFNAQWFHREIWIKNQNIPPFKFKKRKQSK